MAPVNRRWLLKERPAQHVGPEHFGWTQGPMPEPGAGQTVVRTLYLSCDPSQRMWLNATAGGYQHALNLGDPMVAFGVGQVAQSRNPAFKEGDIVQGLMSWEDYMVPTAQDWRRLAPVTPGVPASWNLSHVGITALTAYFGLYTIGAMKAGDAVVISGAAGATGSAAGQLARIKGAKQIIGIAGGREKCDWLTNSGGFDAAIDYKSEKVMERLRALAPEGIDVFFDNVGGQTLDAVLTNLAYEARIVICGAISAYESGAGFTGPRNYMSLTMARARMQGFLVFQFESQYPQAIAELKSWANDKRFDVPVTLFDGLDKAPVALQGLFSGKNLGKTIVKVADPAK